MFRPVAQLSEEALRNHENTQPRSKVGAPRLSPFQASLYDFYEPLVLLELLQRVLGSQKLHAAPNVEHNPQSHPWQVFLNQLAWLCDCKHGGDTTTAIAVEASALGPKYWLTVNFDPQGSGLSHLETVLGKLVDLNTSSLKTPRAILEEILEACLDFSSDKFENYRQSLLRNIQKAKSFDQENSMSTETKLLTDLESIHELEDPMQLCLFAFRYVKSENLRQVHPRYRNNGPRTATTVWYNICHYIGRLGSWVRAIRILIIFVRKHPKVIEGFQTGSISSPGLIIPPPPDEKTNLESVLQRMLPKEEARAEWVLSRLKDVMTLVRFDVEKAIIDKYADKNFKPRVHAEILLLEHFWRKRLLFYGNDRYVGGSKPSCYCCSLYFSLHCGNITTRESHGNAWSKWCLPPELMQDSERFDWETKWILKDMRKKIRLDVMEFIEDNLPRRARMKDSTSGMWTAPTLGMSVL